MSLWDRLCQQAEDAVVTGSPLVFEGMDRIYVQNALAAAWAFANSRKQKLVERREDKL